MHESGTTGFSGNFVRFDHNTGIGTPQNSPNFFFGMRATSYNQSIFNNNFMYTYGTNAHPIYQSMCPTGTVSYNMSMSSNIVDNLYNAGERIQFNSGC